jgi:replicative DNA helicase
MFENKDLNGIEVEQCLLGALLVDNQAVWKVMGDIKPDDFAAPIHGEIYRAINDMVLSGKDADHRVIRLMFEQKGDLSHVGGGRYITDLVDNVISVMNAPEYAKTIVDLAERRRILRLMDETRARLIDYNYEISAQEIGADMILAMNDTDKRENMIKTKREVALAAVESIQLPPNRFATGLWPLDEKMGGGLYAGFTYGIAGAEKRGKTTLAHTISHNLNEQGVLHAYVALEMGSRQIEQRNLARGVGTNSLNFLKPEAQTDKDLIGKVYKLAMDTPNHTLYLDMPGATLEELQIQLAKLVTKHKIKGFILDYWQLVEGQRKGETEEKHLRNVAQWLANFARKHGVWSILLSQVNDQGTLFAGKGLVKACDQLYIIELGEAVAYNQEIWLKMTHSRYTPLGDVGSPQKPALYVNKKAGPYIDVI